jgi:hypothetical protein
MSIFKSKPKCPYCHETLDKEPARKTKCPHCKKSIYVRDGGLLTEEEKIKHDDLEMFRFTEDEYKIKQLELSQKWECAPSHSDTMWGLANGKIPGLVKRKAYYDLRDLYLAMARMLHKGGKDFIEVFKESRKCDLLVYKEGGIEKIQIMTCSIASPSCLMCSGKILSTDEALKTMPIPNVDCLNKNRKEFHICMYMAAPYDFKNGGIE